MNLGGFETTLIIRICNSPMNPASETDNYEKSKIGPPALCLLAINCSLEGARGEGKEVRRA